MPLQYHDEVLDTFTETDEDYPTSPNLRDLACWFENAVDHYRANLAPTTADRLANPAATPHEICLVHAPSEQGHHGVLQIVRRKWESLDAYVARLQASTDERDRKEWGSVSRAIEAGDTEVPYYVEGAHIYVDPGKLRELGLPVADSPFEGTWKIVGRIEGPHEDRWQLRWFNAHGSEAPEGQSLYGLVWGPTAVVTTDELVDCGLVPADYLSQR